MILGNLANTDKYTLLHPLFKEAFEYLKSVDFATAEVGKTELRGKDLFVIISDSTLKSKDDARLEVHNQYIDIQLPVSKAETFGWIDRASLQKESAPFDETKDIQFYGDAPTTYFRLLPTDFAVFFPEDGHAPCIGEGTIRKVVVKIKI